MGSKARLDDLADVTEQHLVEALERFPIGSEEHRQILRAVTSMRQIFNGAASTDPR